MKRKNEVSSPVSQKGARTTEPMQESPLLNRVAKRNSASEPSVLERRHAMQDSTESNEVSPLREAISNLVIVSEDSKGKKQRYEINTSAVQIDFDEELSTNSSELTRSSSSPSTVTKYIDSEVYDSESDDENSPAAGSAKHLL